MKVVDRLTVGKDAGLTIIQIGEKYMLASVSGSKIDVLREIDKEDLIEFDTVGYAPFETNPILKKMIDNVFEKTKLYTKKVVVFIRKKWRQKNDKNVPDFKEILMTRLGGQKRIEKKNQLNENSKAKVVDELLASSISKTKKIKSKINTDEGANNNENE